MPSLLRHKETEPSIENWLASDKPEHQALAEEALERLSETRVVDTLLAIAQREAKMWHRIRLRSRGRYEYTSFKQCGLFCHL